jgi:hypothetical protein
MINKEKHSNKLSEEDKKNIITQYLLDRSKENQELLCTKYNITRQYIHKLTKSISDTKRQEIIDNSIKEYNEEFTKKTKVILFKILDRINKELENTDKIALSQLTTSYGILYDKMRLNENLSTSNNSIKIDIKIE